jgi:glycerol-3-phosphate dehydrogenase (NAD(P)+)
MDKIAIVGTTSWGITLGLLMAGKGNEVRIWARTRKEATRLTKKGPAPERFPAVIVPENVTFSSKMPEVVADASAVILAVPSATMRQNITAVAPFLARGMVVISVAKGLETGSNKRMSRVITEEIEERFAGNVCALSGPNLAREIMKGLPAAAVAAAENMDTARKAQRILTCPRFCVFTNTDIIGVELAGSLKNIIALGAGIADGLDFGDNAKSAFITRGLTEITALGMTLGANPLTFSGLAGLGDVVATCSSPLSRNHYVGTELAKGRPLAEILDGMDQVVEGVGTVLAAHDLALQHGLEMPITEKLHKVLYEDYDPRQAAEDLMGGNVKHELAGRRWRLFSLFRNRERKTPNPPPGG